jgi:hypothetical protein
MLNLFNTEIYDACDAQAIPTSALPSYSTKC